MSDAPSAAPSGGEQGGGAQAPVSPQGHRDPVAVVDEHERAQQALSRRVAEKRARAENDRNGVPQGQRERGQDGKFKPRAAQQDQRAQADDVDVKAKPGDKPAKAEAKPEANAEVEKIKAEAEQHKARAEGLAKQYAEAEDTMGRALARINALEAYVERLQKSGGKLDPLHAENLSMREQIEAREIMQRAAEAKAADDAKAEQEKAKQAEVSAMKAAAQEFFAEGHALNPFAPNGMGPEARQFWDIVTQVNRVDGPKEAIATMKRLAPGFAATAAQRMAQGPAPEARTLRNLGGPAKGAEPRDLSREAIIAKYSRRAMGA